MYGDDGEQKDYASHDASSMSHLSVIRSSKMFEQIQLRQQKSLESFETIRPASRLIPQ